MNSWEHTYVIRLLFTFLIKKCMLFHELILIILTTYFYHIMDLITGGEANPLSAELLTSLKGLFFLLGLGNFQKSKTFEKLFRALNIFYKFMFRFLKKT